VLLLFVQAVGRLGMRGVDAMRAGLTAFQWLALAVLSAAFVYGEGVRALQRRWIPHLVDRLDRLPSEPLAQRLLAPLYAMSLTGAPARTLLFAWSGVAGIVAAVLIVSRFPDPWRGIVDFAVAAALAWATVALLVLALRRLLR